MTLLQMYILSIFNVWLVCIENKKINYVEHRCSKFYLNAYLLN